MKKKAKKTVRKTGGKVEHQKITPLGDRVLLKAIEEKETERKTDSGIFIPDSVKEDKGAKRGKVVAVGAGRYDDGVLIPVSVNVGDTVLYSWGDTLVVDGEEFIVVRESEISAIIR